LLSFASSRKQAYVAGQLTHCLCDATNTLGLDNSDGESTESRDVFRTVASAYPASIFIIVPINDVVTAIFNAPMATIVARTRGASASCGDWLVMP